MERRILILEDHDADALLVEECLNGAFSDHVTCVVDSLELAVDSIRVFRPDIILSDLDILDSSGLETIERLKKHSDSIPIVVLTNNKLNDIGRKAIHVGAQDFISKEELSESLLRKTIDFSIERYAIQRRLEHANQEIKALNEGLEEKIQERTQELEKHLNLRMQFIKNITHEVRTPLTSLFGALQIMRMKKIPAELTVLFDMIESAGDRLQHFFESVLDYTLTQNETFSLHHHIFNLHDTFEDIKAYPQAFIKQSNIVLTTHFPASPIPAVVGDAYHLSKMVKYLIDNAIKFTKAGKIEIRCRLQECEDGGVALQFDVANTGDYIDPKKVDDLFMSFVQGKDKYSDNPGPGLGLSLSKRIAELMGGRITYRYDTDKGNVFSAFIKLDTPVVRIVKSESHVSDSIDK